MPGRPQPKIPHDQIYKENPFSQAETRTYFNEASPRNGRFRSINRSLEHVVEEDPKSECHDDQNLHQ